MYKKPALLGVIGLLSLNIYAAFKLGVFTLSLLATICIFQALKTLLNNKHAAAMGAIAFQLFPFVVVKY